VFSSPAVAAGVVFIGVLNGTLEARDLATGDLLWDFRTPASLENPGWALTADRRFNVPMLYRSSSGEAQIVATARQFAVGSMFSSPLVADGVVYVGSTDGNLYALE
jgi:outer membrane protein assembly factor BamB